ncbi:hypothetical protein ACVJMY_006704 [Bradyrhizobium diazoefficiens]
MAALFFTFLYTLRVIARLVRNCALGRAIRYSRAGSA